jgi:ribosomal protein L37AE/L43A
MSTEDPAATDDAQPRCPTCAERDSEDIGQDVRRCRNCTYVWIPVVPEPEGR